MSKLEHLFVNYDKMSDVLYLATTIPVVGVRYHDGRNGVLLRSNNDGTVVGVTVEDFAYVWADKLDELAGIVSSELLLDTEQVLLALPH